MGHRTRRGTLRRGIGAQVLVATTARIVAVGSGIAFSGSHAPLELDVSASGQAALPDRGTTMRRWQLLVARQMTGRSDLTGAPGDFGSEDLYGGSDGFDMLAHSPGILSVSVLVSPDRIW